MANKTLQERVRETIYPNGVGAITAEKEQALLIEFADAIDTKLGKDNVDAELSTTSTNPVQNKVVSQALNDKQKTISDLDTIRSGAAKGATALQSVPSTYATKTDVDNAIANAITTTLNTAV
jgi:acyl transferase domain-containing protein